MQRSAFRLFAAAFLALAASADARADSAKVLTIYNPQIEGQRVEQILVDPAHNAYVNLIRSLPTPRCTDGNWQAPQPLWDLFWKKSGVEMAWVTEASDYPPNDDTPHPSPTGENNLPQNRLVYISADEPPRDPDPSGTGYVLPVKDIGRQKIVFIKYQSYLNLWNYKLAALALGTVKLGGAPIKPEDYPMDVRLYAACKFKKALYQEQRFDATRQIDFEIEQNAWQGVREGIDGILLVASVPGFGELLTLGGGLAITAARRAVVGRTVSLLERAAAKQAGAAAADLSEGAVARAAANWSLDIAVKRTSVRGVVQLVAFNAASKKVVTMPLLLDDALQVAVVSKTPMRLPRVLFNPGAEGEVTLGLPGRSLLEDLMAGLPKEGLVKGGYKFSGAELAKRTAQAIEKAVVAQKGGIYEISYGAGGKAGELAFDVEYAGGKVSSVSLREARDVAADAAGMTRLARWELHGELAKLLGLGESAPGGASGRLAELLARADSPLLSKQALSKSDSELVQMAAQFAERHPNAVDALDALRDIESEHPGQEQLLGRLRYMIAKAGSQDPAVYNNPVLKNVVLKAMNETSGPLAGVIGPINFWSGAITAASKLEYPELFDGMLRAQTLSKPQAAALVRQIQQAHHLGTPGEALESVRAELLRADNLGNQRVAGMNMLFEKGVLNEASRKQVLALTASDL